MYTTSTYTEKALTDIKVDDLPEISYLSRRRFIANSMMDKEKTYPAINDERRADWDRNHVIIKNMLGEFIHQTGRFTNWEVAAATSFSLCTVQKHVREIDISNLYYRDTLRKDKATRRLFRRIHRASKAGSWKAIEFGANIFLFQNETHRPAKSRWEQWRITGLQKYYQRRVEEELIDFQLDYWGYPSEYEITGRPTFNREIFYVSDNKRLDLIDRMSRPPRSYKYD